MLFFYMAFVMGGPSNEGQIDDYVAGTLPLTIIATLLFAFTTVGAKLATMRFTFVMHVLLLGVSGLGLVSVIFHMADKS